MGRGEQSKPILDRLHKRLSEWKLQLLPKGPMSQAVGYTLNQSKELNVFAGDGAVPMGRIEMWRRGLDSTYLLAGPFGCPCLMSLALLRFPIPLIEPEVQLYRIRLPFRISGLRFRHGHARFGRHEQPEPIVQIGIRVLPVPGPALLLTAHLPSAEPSFGLPAHESINPRDRTLVEVVAPASQDAVDLRHPLGGLLPIPTARRLLVNFPEHPAHRLLRRSPKVARREKMELSPVRPMTAAIEGAKREIEAFLNVKPAPRTAVTPAGFVVIAVGEKLLHFDGKPWENLGAQFGELNIQRVRADAKGTVWIATSVQGLIGLEQAGKVRRYNNDPNRSSSVIYDFDLAADGTLYVGTQHGVYRLHDEAWEQIPSTLFQVGQVLIDRQGRVWLMEITYSQVYVYDGKRFREVKEQTALSSEKLEGHSLRLDDQGNMLVDVPAQPAMSRPKWTFRSNASEEGTVGEPIEVKLSIRSIFVESV